MQLIKNILLATDFMKSSANLVKTAISLGQNFRSDITIIHVVPGQFKNRKNQIMVEENAKTSMEAVAKEIESAGVKVKKTFIRQGSCAEAVIRAADRINANLILIGSSELVKKEAFKLGTTADKIIRKSEVPVWVVRKESKVQIKTIFCPVDFSDASSRALADASFLARSFNARLVIFSVYELYDKSYPRFDPESGGMNKLARTEHEKSLKKFIGSIETAGLDYELVIEAGDAADEILKGIKSYKPDLLIMGTSGKSGLSRWLMGSVTEKVTREVPCTFITVKSKNVLTVELESRVMDMEYHFKAASELYERGLFKEAVDEFLVCLKINDMHIPSLALIAKAYESLGKKDLAENYRNIARSALTKMWDKKIETEVRNHYSL